jgi:hypothetical protein
MLVVAVTSSHLPAECACQSACHGAVSPRVEEGAARPPGRNVTASATSSVLRRLHDNLLCSRPVSRRYKPVLSFNAVAQPTARSIMSAPELACSTGTCSSQPRLCRKPPILQEKTVSTSSPCLERLCKSSYRWTVPVRDIRLIKVLQAHTSPSRLIFQGISLKV